MRVAGLLALAATAASSPMGDYMTALEGRQSMNNQVMDSFKFYAQHAAAAYCNAEGTAPGDRISCGGECDDVMRNGATIIDSFMGSQTGIAGYVSVDDARREIVFSARGSHNVRNFIADILFKKRDCDFTSGCKIHTGFADSWNEIANAATSAIKEGLQANPGYKVVITGHSLGGAVASLAGANLRRAGMKMDIYTFGAPRAGNDAFANFANSQPGGLFRMTHIDDPVPRLPPMIFGYRHSGSEYWLSNGGAMQNRYQVSDVKVCPGIANTHCNAGTFGFDILAHLHYLGDTSDCAPFFIKWKRDDGNNDEELKKRLTDWSHQDQAMVAGGHA